MCTHTCSPHAHIHMCTHTCVSPVGAGRSQLRPSSRKAKCVPPQSPSGFSSGPAHCPRPLLASGLPVAQLGMAQGSIPQNPARQPLLPAQSPDSSLPLPPEPKNGQTTDRIRGEPGFRRIASTRNLCSSCVGFLAEEEARGNRAWRGQSHDHLRTPGITKAPQGGSGAPALVSDTFWASPRDLAFCLPPSVSRAKVGWGPLPTLATPPFWRVQSPKGTRERKV